MCGSLLFVRDPLVCVCACMCVTCIHMNVRKIDMYAYTNSHIRKSKHAFVQEACVQDIPEQQTLGNRLLSYQVVKSAEFFLSVAAEEGQIATSGGWTHAEDFWAMQMIEGIKAYSRHDGAK
jgi:hypothetical protein